MAAEKIMTWLLRLVLAVVLAIGVLPAIAQTPAPPAGMSKEQFDALVEAISQAVVLKLKTAPPAKGAAPSPPAAEAAAQDSVEDPIAEFVDRSANVLSAFPELGRQLIRIPALIGEAGGGRGLFAFIAILLVSTVAALRAEALVRHIFTNVQNKLAARAAAKPGLPATFPLLAILAIDLLGLAAVWLVSYGATGIWFSGSNGQAKLAALILTGIFAWRLYMLAFRVFLRPGLPGARLATMNDAGADAVFRLVSTVILVVVALRVVLLVLSAIQAPHDAFAAGQLVAEAIILGLFVSAAMAARAPMAAWFADLSHVEGGRSLGQRVGAQWLFIAVPFFMILIAVRVYGTVTERYTIPNAMLLTLNAVIALIFVQTLSRYLTRRPVILQPAAAGAPPPQQYRLMDVVARCVRVAAGISILGIVAQSWIVDVFALVDADGWRALTRSSLTTGMTLFLAFVAWELVQFVTRRHSAAPAGAAAGAAGDEETRPGAGSRLATLMPLLRIFLAITISVLALLIVLSELGVNIGPLLAGASVFGLAISFGSQALVRDIVSGVFYLSDDAFRIGEYIQSGNYRGVVEGFSLRSVKLRHQNGPVFTVPFGVLGAVQNMSRDWAVEKLTVGVTYDTDIEKARKIVKKVGQELAQDPELAAGIIEPLKMQGVQAFGDFAIQLRMKMKTRPGDVQFMARRRALAMIKKAFDANGINFAYPTVQVAGGAAAALGDAANAAVAQKGLELVQPAIGSVKGGS